MKKNFLYTALGLMGIMGALSMGVVNAETTITHYTGSNISYTLNGNELFTGVGTITIKDGTDTITILDRNLGAKKAGTGCYYKTNGNKSCTDGDPAYGYLFQWGNNYGFKSVGDLPGEQLSESQVNHSDVGADYTSGVFHYNHYDWIDVSYTNIWGGDIDAYSSAFVKLSESQAEQKRGPCPNGWHVPSAGELYKLKTMVGSASLMYNELKIPFAGMRYYKTGAMSSPGWAAYLLSSTAGYSYYNRYLSMDMSSSSVDGSAFRANAYSVRCFYNKYAEYVEPPQTFKVKFDTTTNGGNTPQTGSVQVTNGETLTLTEYTATKTDWDFVGWNTDSGATVAMNNITVTEPMTLYAIFKKEGTTLTGTIESNGATVTPTETEITCNILTIYNNQPEVTSCPINFPTATRENGTVYGYSTTNSGTEAPEISNGATNYDISASTTFYVISKSDDIVLNVNYLSGVGVQSISKNVDSCTLTGTWNDNLQATSCTVNAPEITSSIGYGNGVWNNSTTTVNPGEEIILTTNGETYTATVTPLEYAITFLDGSGTQTAVIYSGNYNSAVNTDYPNWTKDGYTIHWDKNIPSTMPLNGDTITASWTANTYQVKYEAGEGTGTMENQTFTYDVAQDLTANAFIKTGYTFSGWIYGTTGYTDKQNVNNLTTTDGAIVTLTAQWTPITYIVSYDANGGIGSIASSGYTYDLSGNLAENTFTKTGYVFSGWKYNDEIYTGNQEIKNLTGINGATITMVTQWAPITYSVEFTGTDVSGTMANQDFEYDSGQALNANAFTKTGYEFSGWTYGTTGYTNQQNVINLTTTNNDIITFTAQWTPITYTISFSGNSENATGTAPATINAEYDSGDIAPDNTFTMTGYTFTGWNTETDGSGTGYATGAELKNLTTTGGDDVMLYAQWEVNVHKLNFVVDGTNIQSGDVAYSGAISAPAEPKKDCNSFAGWTSSVEGLTTTGTMPDSDVTFTANWNYTCSRSSGGGGGGSSRNTEKTTETQTGSKVDSSTKATDNEDNTQDSSAEDTEGQNQGKTYSDEFQQAYEFAYKHGITTMPTIEQANMEGSLTRIAMAKMLSYYAINVLGLKPDETRVNKFNDVSDQMDAEYNNAVSLAYQLGIMGINMPNNKFRPNDLVTRGEFATALSRMLYKIADGKDKYYSTHLAKLMEEKIITNDNPNLQELRGYVMIMLMRSAK